MSVSVTKQRILCVWERGAGSGHLYQLSALVKALQLRGYIVVLCVKDERLVSAFFSSYAVTVIGLPAWLETESEDIAKSHAELLMRFGFGKADAIRGYLNRWRRLLQKLKPEHVYCDHSDGALLAAYSLQIRATVIGHGFFHPPEESPVPAYELGLDIDQAAVERADTLVLRSINAALASVGSVALESLTALYSHADKLMTSFPELDCYGERDGLKYLGALGPTERQQEPIWEHEGEKVFCYFTRGCAPDLRFIDDLVAGGYSLLISAPGIADAHANALKSHGVSIQNTPVDLEAVCEECGTIFCEGNHGTTAKILRCGRAPVFIPRQLEQLTTAKRLADQSLGLLPLVNEDGVAYCEAVEELQNNGVYMKNVRAFSNKYENCDESQAEMSLIDELLV